MNRQEILAQYDVDERGIIQNPGKFEGEMLYSPYFWDAFLNGFADEDNDEVIFFDVRQEDIDEFPELKDITRVQLYESDSGFVYCSTVY